MHAPELNEGDASAVLGLVRDLTSVQTLDEYAMTTMIGLTELIPCIDASFNEMNPAANRIAWQSVPANSRMGEYAPLFAELMQQNPLVRHFEETEDTRAMMWSDLVPLDQLRKTELYQEMFRPLVWTAKWLSSCRHRPASSSGSPSTPVSKDSPNATGP